MLDVASKLKGKVLLAYNSFDNEMSLKIAEMLGITEEMMPKVRLFK